MDENHTWYIVYLTDGTEQHAHATHIGFTPNGASGGEVIFYGDDHGSRVDMQLPMTVIDRIQVGRSPSRSTK